jgi:hypothetical protein
MSARIAVRNAKRRRRTITAVWVGTLSVLIIVLIYWELTALLYVLATLGVTALLVVVALSDIAHAEQSTSQSSLAGPSTTPVPAVGKTDWGVKNKV